MGSPRLQPNAMPSALYTTGTFYTLGGASTGVWMFAAVFGQYFGPHLNWLRGLALVIAVVISFVDASRRHQTARSDLVVAFFNGLLIYASATGINAVSTGTGFGRGNSPGAQSASFLPFVREQALWPSLELIHKQEALQREGAILQPPVDDAVLRTERPLNETKNLELCQRETTCCNRARLRTLQASSSI